MKKPLVIILALLLMSALVLGACSEEAATPETPTPEITAPETTAPETTAPEMTTPEETTTETTATGDIIEMKLGHSSPPMGAWSASIDAWVQEVHEATGGRVNITVYPASTLGSIMDEWDMVNSGIMDIGTLLMTPPGVMPLREACSLPYLLPANRPDIVNKVFEEYLYQDFVDADVKLLWPIVMTPSIISTTEKPVSTLEDVEGLQIRMASSKWGNEMLKALGATPVTIPSPEVYSAMEKGIVDGCVLPMEAMKGLKLSDVTQYHIYPETNSGATVAVMNRNTWNSLPADIQGIFEDLCPVGQDIMFDYGYADDQAALELCLSEGHEIITLSEEEAARWVEATAPVVDAWAAETDAMGLPGTEVVELLRKLGAE